VDVVGAVFASPPGDDDAPGARAGAGRARDGRHRDPRSPSARDRGRGRVRRRDLCRDERRTPLSRRPPHRGHEDRGRLDRPPLPVVAHHRNSSKLFGAKTAPRAEILQTVWRETYAWGSLFLPTVGWQISAGG